MEVDEVDPAAQAFQSLSQYVKGLEEKIDCLIAATANAPNAEDLRQALQTPLTMAEQLQAGVMAQQATQTTLVHECRAALREVQAHQVALQAERVQVRGLRARRVQIIGVTGVFLGAALALGVIGVGLRAAPDDWKWQEKAAAWLMKSSAWESGSRMLRQEDPTVWGQMVDGYYLIDANQKAYQGCLGAAERDKLETTCELKVKPPEAASKQQ